MQDRAGRVGFDWPDAGAVRAKIAEETGELVEARAAGDAARAFEEYGDLMFVLANLARHRKIDPEAALRAASIKFTRRFHAIEAALAAQGPRSGRLDARRDGRALGRREGGRARGDKVGRSVRLRLLPTRAGWPQEVQKSQPSRRISVGWPHSGQVRPTPRAAPGPGASLQSVAPPDTG